jgi:hypothetical protein
MRLLTRFMLLPLSLRAAGVIVPLAIVACESSSSPPEPDASGTVAPTNDGSVCACASPDCLPNCKDLPPCTLECVDGLKLAWVDPCGNTQYAENCDAGCTDAGTPACQ